MDIKKIKTIFDPSIKISKKSALIFAFISTVFFNILLNFFGDAWYAYYIDNIHPILLMKYSISLYYLTLAVLIIVILITINIIVVRSRSKFILKIHDLNKFSDLLTDSRSQVHWELRRRIEQIYQKGRDDKSNVKIVMDRIFKTILTMFSVEDYTGGAIILPEKTDPTTLKFWYSSPDQQLSPKCFSVAKSGKKRYPRGTAGTVFLDQKPRVVNIINRETGEADDKSFHNFGIDRPITPYVSFINLPLLWNRKSYGVLSLECQKKDGFSFNDFEFLQEISNRIGEILDYYQIISIG